MNPFPSRVCPLCSKKLLTGDEDSAYTYYCSEFYLATYPRGVGANRICFSPISREWVGSKMKEPHYALNYSYDGKGGIWSQSVVTPPFWILSDSETKKSRIFKFSQKEIEIPSDDNQVMEVDLISPDNYLPEKLSQKIKNLLIFT